MTGYKEMLNTLSKRAKGDRKNIKNEIEKIENFSSKKKKIILEDI